MSTPGDWSRAFARQADADLRAWELYAAYPEAVASECHTLLFLQMSCEKLCKAHLITGGASPESVQTSHAKIAGPLPGILREQMIRIGQDPRKRQGVLKQIRHIAIEIELLSPAVDDGKRRPDNCEYPWQSGPAIHSPLDHTFEPSRLLSLPAGTTFMKLLRLAITASLK